MRRVARREEEKKKDIRKHDVLVGEQRNKAMRREEAEGWDRACKEWRRREEIREGELFHSVLFISPRNAANLISLPLFANHRSLISSFIQSIMQSCQSTWTSLL